MKTIGGEFSGITLHTEWTSCQRFHRSMILYHLQVKDNQRRRSIVYFLSFFSFTYYLYWDTDLVDSLNHMLWLSVGTFVQSSVKLDNYFNMGTLQMIIVKWWHILYFIRNVEVTSFAFKHASQCINNFSTYFEVYPLKRKQVHMLFHSRKLWQCKGYFVGNTHIIFLQLSVG